MTTIKIQYQFTPEFRDQLFIERAERRTGVEITLTDAQLTPAGRQALLIGRVPDPSYTDTVSLPYADDAEDLGYRQRALQSLSEFRALRVTWPEAVGSEPSVDDARRDAETALLAHLALTPTLETRHAAGVARLAAEKAADAERDRLAREARLAEIREGGIEGLVQRDPEGQWRNTYGPDSRDRIIEAKAALGADAYDRAKAMADERNAAEAAERKTVERAWIVEHAPDMLARFEEGLLPAEELLARVRDQAFAPLAELPRYAPLKKSAVEHHEECTHEDVHFGAGDADELTAEQYATLVRVRELSPAGATVQAREHSAWCDGCPGRDEIVTRCSALVTVQWAGRSLSREYAL